MMTHYGDYEILATWSAVEISRIHRARADD
jgi:hypothetical protein